MFPGWKRHRTNTDDRGPKIKKRKKKKPQKKTKVRMHGVFFMEDLKCVGEIIYIWLHFKSSVGPERRKKSLAGNTVRALEGGLACGLGLRSI